MVREICRTKSELAWPNAELKPPLPMADATALGPCRVGRPLEHLTSPLSRKVTGGATGLFVRVATALRHLPLCMNAALPMNATKRVPGQ